MTDIEKGLKDVMQGMFASITEDNNRAYDEISGNPAIESARKYIADRNTEEFYLMFLYPLMSPIEGFLENEFPGNTKAQFLFQRIDFVEIHFLNLIEKIEGSACSADKSRTIMRCIARFLIDGSEIKFDYEQEYTYHLPKKVFLDHESIMNFFDAIYNLYYGDHIKYIYEIQRIYCTAK